MSWFVHTRISGVWRSPAFVRLWAAQMVSLFGSEISAIAVPLTAVLVLGATPTQMGSLIAAETIPYALVGFVAGVWVDRLHRRPVLIATDLLRAVLLISIPLAAVLHVLLIEHLYVISFGVGVLTVLFGAASQSYLPTLVQQDDLVAGNSTLEVSRAAAQIVGPSIGGALIHLVTAPLAIAADAVSFLLSALWISGIRTPEPASRAVGMPAGMGAEIRDGLRFIWNNAILRDTTISSALYNIASGIVSAVYLLYVTRTLGIGAAVLGVILASGNVGVLAGALVTGWVVRRFGVGPTIAWTALTGGVGAFLVPLAHRPVGLAVALLVGARLLDSLADTIFVINVVSVRQAITPMPLQGRVNASVRAIADGVLPLGALLGGLLGQQLGLRPTLILGAAMGLLSVLWLWRSPVRMVREVPRQMQDLAAHPS